MRWFDTNLMLDQPLVVMIEWSCCATRRERASTQALRRWEMRGGSDEMREKWSVKAFLSWP